MGLEFTSAKCFGRKIIIGMRALPAMPWNNSFGPARTQLAITRLAHEPLEILTTW